MKSININTEAGKNQLAGRVILADRDDYRSEEDFQFAYGVWKKERGESVEIVTIVGDLSDDEIKISIIGPKGYYNEEEDAGREYVFL